MDLTIRQRPWAMKYIVKTLAHMLDHGWIPLGYIAYLLGVTRETVYQWSEPKRPPCTRLGGVTRVMHEDVIRFLKQYPRNKDYISAVLSLYNTMKAQRTYRNQSPSTTEQNQDPLNDPDLTEEERQWLRHMYF